MFLKSSFNTPAEPDPQKYAMRNRGREWNENVPVPADKVEEVDKAVEQMRKSAEAATDRVAVNHVVVVESFLTIRATVHTIYRQPKRKRKR